MRLQSWWPLAAALFLLPNPSFAAPDLVRTLPNKVTIVVREIHSRPIVSIQAWVRAGMRDEAPRDRGIAIGTAQCIMDATATREPKALQKEVLALAGGYQSEAGYDYSHFDLTLPSRSFAKGVDLLADGLLHARLDQAVVDPALGRARALARTVLGQVDQASVNYVRAELHAGTPLVSPLAIPEDEFTLINPTLIQRFYHEYYVAENMTIMVSGDVDAEDAVKKVEEAFQGAPRGKAASRSRFSEKAFDGPKVQLVKASRETPGATVTIGFRAPAWGTADALALDAMMSLLVDSPISRTQKKLNAGNAEFLRAIAIREYETDGGTVALSFGSQPDSLDDAEGAALAMIQQARSTPIGSEEFEAAIRTLLQRNAFERETQAGSGHTTALAVLRGAPGSDEVYVQRLKALRPEDLIAAARKYLDLKTASIVEMGPEESIGRWKAPDVERRVLDKIAVYDAAYRNGPQVTASADNERTARVDAPLRSISPQPVNAGRGRVVRSTLAGGARLLVSEDHSAPSVTVAMYFLGGVRYETPKNNGIDALLRETLLNSFDPDTKGMTYRQSLSLLGSIVSYQDKDMWGCVVALPSDSWRSALERMGRMFAHPDLERVNVDATRIYVLDEQDTWSHDDQAQRERLIFPTKYQVSGYRLPALGTHTTIAGIPQAEIQEHYRKFVVQPNLVVAVFGDVQAGEVSSAVTKAIADISTKPFQPGTVAKEGEFDGFREKWELGQGSNTTVTVAFNGPPARSSDVPALYVFASLLAGPKGWFEEYIIKTGGAKGANAIVSQALDECPMLATVTVGGPLQEEDMVKLLFRQIKKAALLPLRGDLAPDLLHAKTLAAGTYQMGLDSNPTRAFQFARSELFGLGVDYPLLLPARIDAITSDDMLAIGLKYFQKDQWTRAPYAVCETRPGGW